MAGIYLHIPFCKKACVYCDFHFVTTLRRKGAMVSALVQEIELRKNFFDSKETPIESIYFGGGTPSILSALELEGILQQIHTFHKVMPFAEITLEANPDDLSPTYVSEIQSLGINRLSIGLQSFEAHQLQWMNRTHTAEQGIYAIQNAQNVGIDNISIDLIFGLPDMKAQEWEKALQKALDLKVPHLSVYALTVEPKTALLYQIKQQKTVLPQDDLFAQQFLLAHEFLGSQGYKHYEVSNYALPQKKAKHNSAYWKGVPYLGLGPSAHSYDGKRRSWNLANNSAYLQKISAMEPAIGESELLTQADRYHEYIMTGLRTHQGINTNDIHAQFGIHFHSQFQEKLHTWLTEGLMVEEGDTLRLSAQGWLISDSIVEALFIETE